MKKGFSPATIAIVAVLLGALGLPAKQVTPAPPGPPEQTKPAPVAAATPTDDDDNHTPPQPPPISRTPHKLPVTATKTTKTTPDKPKFNPNSIDVDTVYWKTNKDGQKGIAEMDARMKQATAEQEAERKAQEAGRKKTGDKGAMPAAK